MKELLFMLADVLMISGGFYAGWQFLRDRNYLLGLEWLIVGSSGVNFLVWSLLGGDQHSVQFDAAFFLDAFSRSVGITVILVIGLMRVTHRYKPSVGVEVGLFTLAIGAGLYLQQFRAHELHVAPASIYLGANLLTTVFLAYFAWRLMSIGETAVAAGTAIVTVGAAGIALAYDFFPVAESDPNRTGFYAAALAIWGLQLFTYRAGYSALERHNVEAGKASVDIREGAVHG